MKSMHTVAIRPVIQRLAVRDGGVCADRATANCAGEAVALLCCRFFSQSHSKSQIIELLTTTCSPINGGPCHFLGKPPTEPDARRQTSICGWLKRSGPSGRSFLLSVLRLECICLAVHLVRSCLMRVEHHPIAKRRRPALFDSVVERRLLRIEDASP